MTVNDNNYAQAYVDTYNYKFPICSATIKEIGNVAYSFYDKKDLLLANYKGDKADQCKGNINTAWMRVVIQSKMMAVVGEVCVITYIIL